MSQDPVTGSSWHRFALRGSIDPTETVTFGVWSWAVGSRLPTLWWMHSINLMWKMQGKSNVFQIRWKVKGIREESASRGLIKTKNHLFPWGLARKTNCFRIWHCPQNVGREETRAPSKTASLSLGSFTCAPCTLNYVQYSLLRARNSLSAQSLKFGKISLCWPMNSAFKRSL